MSLLVKLISSCHSWPMSPTGLSSIEQLRLLPEDERVQALRTRKENQWFDRKSVRTRARELADAMVGFANAEGGLVVLGISNGMVEGIGHDDGAQNAWRQAGRDFAQPPISARFELIACATDSGVDGHLLLTEIDPSEHVHENVRGEVYLRIGDENRRLTPLEAQELRYDKGTTFFDGTPVTGTTREDLDDNLVSSFLRAVGGAARPDESLASRGLLTRTRSGFIPTVAGVLTLGCDPQQFFPEARLRLLRYQGTVRETGTRSNILADSFVDGVLRAQILGARRILRRWLGVSVRLQRSGRFRPASLIPEDVWLEAIVNAIVHRSYSMGGDHVRVSLFADRLEVEIPGEAPRSGSGRNDPVNAVRPQSEDRANRPRTRLRSRARRGCRSDV